MSFKKTERVIDVTLLCLYLGYWFVKAMMSIGQPAKMGIVAEWWLPFAFLAFLGVPAVLGYWIGRNTLTGQ